MFLALMLALAIQGAATRGLDGVVVDASGGAVQGAHVIAVDGGRAVAQTRTHADGTFRIDLPGQALTVRVTAPGFADRDLPVPASERGPLRIDLQPRAITETVTVASDLGEFRVATPASATVLNAEELATTPSWTLDDQLRTVPGFSLFRRSSSRVANPTTQGVTLRGLAASGASRALVLADGVPLNDPFGGWVYWDRLPAAAIDRVEVARGGAGDLHGSDAVGGAVRIESAGRTGVRVLADGGSNGTARGSVYGGQRLEGAQVFGAVESFTTDGFVIVAPESRGPIDVPATSRHTAVYLGTNATLPRSVGLNIRGGYFTEDRGNGTPFQINGTIIRQVSASGTGAAWGGGWTARTYGFSQDYDQTFSAVLAGRAAERPTSAQHVDSSAAGGSVEWLRAWGRTALLASGSLRQVNAELTDRALPSGAADVTEARQRTGALVVQTTWSAREDMTVAAGARGEVWSSHRAAGTAGAEQDQTIGFLVPRAAVSWRATPLLSLRGAFQGAYRSPTINELYRPFRVGNVLTQANPDLRAEESIGVEGSALLTPGRAAVRIIGFWTRLDDAIVNVTLTSDPQLILRQRQNAARIRARGVEVETDLRLAGGWSVTGSAARLDSTFTEGAGLEGLVVPQVPRWQAAAGVVGTWPRATVSLDWRFIDRQFDDDRNQFPLDPSRMLNARAAWRVRRGLEVFGAIENAFDEEQDVGRTPLRTIGLPRTARAGIRIGRW